MSATTTPKSRNAPVASNELYDFDVDGLNKIDELRREIRLAEQADDPITHWSWILQDHITYGNTKLANHLAIFNMNSAHDCDNRETERCQVGDGECYAVQTEKYYTNSLDYRRRQEVLWDHLDPVTFAKAFREHAKRKRIKPTAIRFSQSGDFRNQQDILKVDEIARRLDDLVDVYTYSASSHLDWEEAENFVVNASNGLADYGDRRFIAVPSEEQIPDDPSAIHCPYDYSDGEIECGECRLCISSDAGDVYVTVH